MTKQIPLVSIICTTYNQEQYIAQAIDGFLMQKTNFPFEIIVHDDASTDNTATIIKDYESKNPNLFVTIYQSENKHSKIGNGIWAEIVFPKAQGKYIATCEGDDYWDDPLKLQKQFEFMEHAPNVSFSFHGGKTLASNGKFGTAYSSARFLDKQIVPLNYFFENGGGTYCTASAMFLKKITLDPPSWFSKAPFGDYPLMFLAIQYGDIGYLSDEMCVYRTRSLGSWSSSNLRFNKRINNYYKLIKLNKEIDSATNRKYRKYLNLTLYSYILGRMKHKLKIAKVRLFNLIIPL